MRMLESSMIRCVAYSRKDKILSVEFMNGSRYSYANISYFKYRSLVTASSVGKYFHRSIRRFPGKYPYSKVV